MQFFESPFFRKIFLVLALVVFAGFGTLTFWISSSVKASFRETQLSTLQDALHRYKRGILGWLAEKRKDVEGLARVFEFSPQMDPSFLRAFRQTFQEYADILILDGQGKLLANSGSVPLKIGLDLSDREYFKVALGGSSFVSGFFRGRSRGMATLSIGAPIRIGGKPEKVIAGFITLEKFLELFHPEAPRITGTPGIVSVHFVNAKGQIISQPEYRSRYPMDPNIEEDSAFRSESEAVRFLLEKKEGASVYQHQGRGFYGAYSWIAPIQIGLVFEADQEVLERPLNRQLQSLILSSCLIFLILVGIMLFILWFLSKPLYQLNQAMEKIIHEGPRGEVVFKKTGSHVDRLVDTFKKLQQAVDQRETQLKDKAVRDPLTGLYNHGMLEDLVQKEYHRRKRSGKPLCFLMIDIDHFKNINDNYGHAVGDQVLREVSRILESCVRAGDIVARYGGEEFAILVDSDQPEVSLTLAERVRSRIESHPFIVNGEKLPLTVSVGWVCLKTDKVPDSKAIVKEADDELYRAKEAGRNRVSGHARV